MWLEESRVMFFAYLFLHALTLTAANEEAPRIEISPQNQTVVHEGIAFFMCTASGTPKPKVEWRKHSKLLFSARFNQIDIPNGSVLRIEPVSQSRDETLFTCVAENGIGEPATATAALTVLPSDSVELPTFVPQRSFQFAGKGLTALLSCQVDGDSQSRFIWLKNMVPLNMTMSRYSITDGSLQIIDVEDEDEGSYECVAENSVALAVQPPIKLYVKETPRIEISPQNQTVVHEGIAFFVCTATGNPKPKIEWQRNSKSLFSSRYIKIDIPNGSVLRIEPVRQGRDDAMFKCVADNSFGELATATAALTVLPSHLHGSPQFTPQRLFKIAQSGHIGLLSCKAYATPRPRITWLKNMVPLNMTISRYLVIDGSLQIIDVEHDDEGNYECVAENSVSLAVQHPIKLYVREAPQIEKFPPNQTVVHGGIAFFVCTATGNPKPKIEWQRNSRSLFSARFNKLNIPNGSVLRIEPVRQSRDEAIFKCVAENGVGEPAAATATLTVLPSRSYGYPHFDPGRRTEVAECGHNALLPCHVYANPWPQITWLKNMVPLNMSAFRYYIRKDSLQIFDIGDKDEGSYECVAENSVGLAVQPPIKLYVKERSVPSKFTITPDSVYEVKPGSNLNITCAAVGDPMPSVEWFLGDTDITPQDNKPIGENVLMLENISLPAKYTCVAKSKLGTIETNTSIVVQDLSQSTNGNFPGTVNPPDCECEHRPPMKPENKNCIPVYQSGCACPGWFACPDVNSTVKGMLRTPKLVTTECVYEGKTYRSGEEIKTIDYCVNCSCSSIPEGAEVVCEAVDCPELFQLPLDRECYKVYEDGKCCAIDAICVPTEPEITVHLVQNHPHLIAEVSWTQSSLEYEHLESYRLRYGGTHTSQMVNIMVDAEILNQTISYLDRGANYSFFLSAWNKLRWGPEAVAYLSTPQADESLDILHTVLPEDLPPSFKCPTCDLRYLKHYEVKNCFPVFSGNCSCPARFDCPDVQISPGNVCVYKEKIFKVKEVIPTGNPCQRCKCRRSFLGGVEMSCLTVECPWQFQIPPRDECYKVYEKDKCCPAFKCTDQKSRSQGKDTESSCRYEGKIYSLGERIYPKINPCLSCLCSENWTEGNFDDCQVQECLLERKLQYLRKGCIPIYHKDKCCPTEFYCGAEDAAAPNNNSFPEFPGSCVFEGKSYFIGEVLDVKDPTNCITCTCEIPPQFTCIRKDCPGPPNDDYRNCRAIYQEGECCPRYDCLKPPVSVTCELVKCSDGCQEVAGRDGCSLCLCDKLLCTIPKCPDVCEMENNVSAGSCPRCRCPSDLTQLAPVRCSPVQCDPQCFEVTGSDGCLTCICGPLCSTQECGRGCSLQREVPQGQCRGCVCSSSPDQKPVDGILHNQEIKCAPVICGPTCRETVGKFGCPTCICDSCPLLNCSSDCELELAPVSGECPKCACH